jgi:hypothetical protein
MMVTLIVAFLLTADVNPGLVIRDTVDVIEVNHVYSEGDGKKRLSQVIFWEFKLYNGEFRVVDWRMQDAVDAEPRYDHRRRLWVLMWWDSKNNCIRRVHAISFKETHTWYDPEVDDRKELAIEHRRLLSRVP